MFRTRALNRSNRLNAKRRRRTLRSVLPSLQDSSRVDNSQVMLRKTTLKEASFDLIDHEPTSLH